MLRTEPKREWRRFRLKSGTLEVHAIQMPEAFEIRTKLAKVDQRKAGARNAVQYVALLKGEAGDYLVIVDPATGTRAARRQALFEETFAEVPDKDV